MTNDEHKARHQVLHEAFDELLADYLRWNRNALPSCTTVMELMDWSFEQTKEPRHPVDEGDAVHAYAVCAHCNELVTDAAAHTCNAELMERGR